MAAKIKQREIPVVNDEKSMLELFFDALSSNGLAVRSTANGKQTVRANLRMKDRSVVDIRQGKLSYFNVGMILKRIY